MTGGKITHDLIVWGDPRKREKKLLQKPITSELGTIAPYIIGPGEWDDKEVIHHARYFATVLMNNNGCNCMAPQVLILPETGFPVDKFLAALKGVMQQRPHAPPYYPGTKARYDSWVAGLESVSGASTEFIRSDVKLPPGRFGPPLAWALSTVDFSALCSGALGIVTQEEAFGPTLAITRVPGGGSGEGSFWERVSDFCNDTLFGSLAATVVMHPSCADEGIVARLRYGSVGVNSWGGQSFGFSGGTWGAFPGESLESVESGIGQVRNYLLLEGAEKTVVRAPFLSKAHIGVGCPPDLKTARWLSSIFSYGFSTARHNHMNEYLTGNFRPIVGEHTSVNLEMVGSLPVDFRGCYIRNGTNQRHAPTGKMHMFDGDSMLHAFIFENGQCTSYSNSYVRSPRYEANEEAGRELFASFGDLTVKPPLEAAKKMGWIALQQRAGSIPDIPTTQNLSPATATQLIGGNFYACMEFNSPFRIFVNPVSGQVVSGKHNDFGGRVPVFSAHSKVDPAGNIFYFSKGPRSPDLLKNATNHFGVIDANGDIKARVDFTCGPGSPPAFLHDCFVTKSWAVCVDHSLRADAGKIATSGYFHWDATRNVRLGLLPRDAKCNSAMVEWYDLGIPGFVWHCVAASQDGDRVTCWMPICEEDYSAVPIHLPCEPHAYLYKIVINTASNAVEEMKKFTEIGPTERCSTNNSYVGELEPRFAYLMSRGSGEMYDGFIKFDLHDEKVLASVSYGEGCSGGEAYFQPNDGAADEDDGWLIDIIYDKNTDSSKLCFWNAKQLDASEPVAKIMIPHRIPYGVHASFLTQEELERQWKGH
jgi:carotenoid cleavage dioxygenase